MNARQLVTGDASGPRPSSSSTLVREDTDFDTVVEDRRPGCGILFSPRTRGGSRGGEFPLVMFRKESESRGIGAPRKRVGVFGDAGSGSYPLVRVLRTNGTLFPARVHPLAYGGQSPPSLGSRIAGNLNAGIEELGIVLEIRECLFPCRGP